jgi:hypothetical protein
VAEPTSGQGPAFVYPLPRNPADLIKNPELLWRILESHQRRVGGPGFEDRVFFDASIAAMGDATLSEVAAATEELRGTTQVLDAGQQALAAQVEEEARSLRSDFAASRATDGAFGEGEVQQEIHGLRSELSALRALVDAERGSDHIGVSDITGTTPIIYDGHGGISLGTVPIANGGTGQTSAAAALVALGGQPLDTDLSALAANSVNGLWARTGSGTGSARTLTGPASGITVTNGDGVSGNPTLALANDLSALEAISSTSVFPVRTATDTWAGKDYIEDTWTPTITFATPGDVSVSYGSRSGNRRKIGSLVFIDFTVTFTPTFTTASGALLIGGFTDAAASTLMGGHVKIADITRTDAMMVLVFSTTTALAIRCISTTGTNTSQGATQFATGVQHTVGGSILYIA